MIEQTAQEVFESLNGFDEIAITKTFGRTVVTLSKEDEMQFARALVFICERRNGLKDNEAKQAAFNLTIKEIEGYFPDPPVDLDPDEPSSELGKGAEQPS